MKKLTSLRPVPGYEHCYNVSHTGEKILWYLIDENGNVWNYKKGSEAPVKHQFYDKDHTIGPLVRLIDKHNKAKMFYVRRLVYTAFGKENISGVIVGDYNVVNIDGNHLNNNIDNLMAVSRTDQAKANLHKSRNKFDNVFDLPQDSFVFDGSDPLERDQIGNAYFLFKDLYHEVLYLTNVNSEGKELSGILAIRVSIDSIPSYYEEYLSEKREIQKDKDSRRRKKKRLRGVLNSKDKQYQTLPVNMILMHEKYNNPRPSVRYHITYKDSNPMNLQKENLEWENPMERYERIRTPEHEAILRKIGKARSKEDTTLLRKVERMHFLEGISIADAVRQFDGDTNTYFRVYHHIAKVKKKVIEAKDPKVREFLINQEQ